MIVRNHGISDLPEVVRHKRSKSFPDSKGFNQNLVDHLALANGQSNLDMKDLSDSSKETQSKAEIKDSLKQEIVHLKKMLNNQVIVRDALQNALTRGTSAPDIANESIIPETATELIRQTAVLEEEVRRLEQSLLTMYRKVFDEKIPSISPSVRNGESKSPKPVKRLNVSRSNVTSPHMKYAERVEFMSKSNSMQQLNSPDEDRVDSGIRFSHSALYKSSPLAKKPSPLPEAIGTGEFRASHSQPLSKTKFAKGTPIGISLAEHLGSYIPHHNPDLANKISEEMVKSISNLYCKFADPSANHGNLSSSSSFPSSLFSSKDQTENLGFRNDYYFDITIDNPFQIEGLKNLRGPYSSMVEVCVNREILRFSDSKHSLHNFRNLISQLEYINPRKMTHEKNLAFWINVHNALVMHAYLVFGLPRNNREKMVLLTKAAYNIGGEIISADVIKNSILGCRTTYSGMWIKWLLATKTRFKSSDERHGYAIERPEPLLHFALSTGNYYDPAVLVYTPKKVFQKLETAKDDYIRAMIDVLDQKIHVPKIVESYSKELGLCSKDIMKMMQLFLPESVWKNIRKHQSGLARQSVKWIPHNFTFRYIVSKNMMN